jgi:DNA polymerase-4
MSGPSHLAEPILHVDMDAFFVEVERLHDRSLLGRPVVVGGTGNRSVVAAASYEARRFGIGSAMPMAKARRLCPNLVIVAPDHSRYAAVSEQVFAIFRSFTPLVEGLSVDEAFLDVAGLRLHHQDGRAVGEAIRAAIREGVGIPASVGVATTKFIAKLASQRAKPDGLLVVPAGDELSFLHPLPVGALWGVGHATHAALEQLGVETIGDLAALPERTLRGRLGDSVGVHLFELAHARDPRPVNPDGETKSISVEQTYEFDLVGLDQLEVELLRHSERVAARARRSGLAGRTAQVKIRFSDFTTITRSETLPAATNVARDIYQASRRLLERASIGSRAVRLIGVGLSGLTATAEPRQLAVDRPAKWDELASALGDVHDRFGAEAVEPARLKRTRAPGADLRES